MSHKSADPLGDWLAAEESLGLEAAIEVRRNDGTVEILAGMLRLVATAAKPKAKSDEARAA